MMGDGHRLTIFHDDRSWRERRERLLDDMRRQVDEDLKRFGFGRHAFSTDLGLGLAGATGGSSLWSNRKELDPIGRLSQDFFRLKPSSPSPESRLAQLSRSDEFGSRESLDDATVRGLFTEGTVAQAQGKDASGRLFSMSFDVKEYDAEDISVTVEDQTLIVKATRRTEKDGAVSVKEFSRKVKIPQEVDPEKLTSTLSSDGILTVEAPAPPVYHATSADSLTSSSYGSQGQNGSPLSSPTPRDALAAPAPLDTPIFSWDETAGRRKLQLVLEIGPPYTADDVVVKLDGRRLIIEATHTEKFQGRASKTSMQRDFDLAEDIDISSIRALLQSNNQLSVTAYVK